MFYQDKNVMIFLSLFHFQKVSTLFLLDRFSLHSFLPMKTLLFYLLQKLLSPNTCIFSYILLLKYFWWFKTYSSFSIFLQLFFPNTVISCTFEMSPFSEFNIKVSKVFEDILTVMTYVSELAPCLNKLFLFRISTFIFPTLWKREFIQPVLKSEIRLNPPTIEV